jgi:hypothetical protein
MSTRIDELPGEMEYLNDLSQIQDDINENPRQINEMEDQNGSNVKMNIKKRVRFKDNDNDNDENDEEEDESDLIQYLKSQFSEENILIFVLLIISSRSDFDNYMTKLPFISNYLLESSIMTTILKSIMLIIIYILFKRYILSSIKM